MSEGWWIGCWTNGGTETRHAFCGGCVIRVVDQTKPPGERDFKMCGRCGETWADVKTPDLTSNFTI